MDQAVIYHKDLAESTRWQEMPFAEQMANVGSEVFRASKWKEKGKTERALSAADRALELLDFTILAAQNNHRSMKELTRLREVLCDFFYGQNQYDSSQDSLNRYFNFFSNIAAGQRALAREPSPCVIEGSQNRRHF